MWSGSSNTVCDGNVFLECERAIAYGLGPQAGFPHSHSGGVVSNNFIYREASQQVDASISVWDSPDTRVLHNTVIQNGTYPNAIEYRFASTTGVLIANNLTDGAIQQRDGASATVSSNLTNANASLFVDAASADLHLAASASAAIDQGQDLADCPADWDDEARPDGPARDIGADEWTGFRDVPPGHLFHDFVNAVARAGVTAGCAANDYCPDASVTRAQMAVFLLKSKFGPGHVPPPATGVFSDVPAESPFAPWVEEVAALQISVGCGGGRFCPQEPVTRGQMAVFLLKTLLGSDYAPAAATGTLFADVPQGGFAAAWIEDLYNRGITGGCQASPLLYCPSTPVTRGQMAVFLVRTFSL
jgi:hypothetical protein